MLRLSLGFRVLAIESVKAFRSVAIRLSIRLSIKLSMDCSTKPNSVTGSMIFEKLKIEREMKGFGCLRYGLLCVIRYTGICIGRLDGFT